MNNISNWQKFNESVNYERVLPRDLFNESKLLKCIGRLALLVHEGKALGIRLEYNGGPFVIIQNPSDGHIMVDNINFYYNDELILFSNKLNSKDAYPLEVKEESIEVFDDNGNFTEDFIDYLGTL